MSESNTASQRDIPLPPGGGSWRFDEARWEWAPNDATPAPQPAPAEQAAAPIDVPAAEQLASQE